MVTTQPMSEISEPLTLDLEPGTVPPLVAVRRWAARALSDLGEDHLVAVQLVATEILTNAHEHAGGAGQLRLWRERDPCRIRVEVDDPSPRRPELRRPDPASARGRGLAMVAKLTEDWGSRRRSDGGKTVWAAIDCTTYPWGRCP
ncbi:ATP-binding protein [Amycolatopsis thermoflava]|uniref:ATP-binding protein n=1 Tax=Amycolatopsis thermoflava TaxID=84480 RepID=UPI0038146869